MGRKKKQPEYLEIEIPHEDFITAVSKLDVPLNEILKSQNMTWEEFYLMFDEYHKAVDLKLEQDKQKRKDLKELFKKIEVGLKELRENTRNIPIGDTPKKSYVKINIGGEWVDTEPLKRMGSTSTVKIINKDEELIKKKKRV
ncbi:MAG: hypothetical protein ACFFDB_00625 [Promethearchaeota archaeon]